MSSESFSAAPYPGLRPFEAEECDIFFGREKQTDELLATLQRNRFLAVLGPSGCGKSSLVRAGLIAALETGFMVEAGSRWRVARMRPGDRPIRRLAECLLTPSLLGERMQQPHAALFLQAALERGPLGLVEVVAESHLRDDANLLLLVDQFEEIFRFRAQGNPDEADAFVALLLATAAQNTLPIYVIITMRSDFLGDCSLFRDLPEAINRGDYLIPRLTREQCAAAITGPARVFGGDVEPALVNRLLNDFGPDPDQLPVLQHALMRMWFRRREAEPAGRIVLTTEDYERLGGLRLALSDHADEVMRELTPAQVQLAKVVFQRLTERGTGRRDTRAPARLSELATVGGVDIEDLVPVMEAFRRAGRNFLTPPEGALRPETLIDIGHESLIREWRQLAAWVDEEGESAAMYARLRETARLWQVGQAGLWSNPDLARAVEWRDRVRPSDAWAARYGDATDFTRAMQFLDASEAEHRARESELQRARELTLRRARRLAMALGAVVIALLGAMSLAWYGWYRPYERHFNSYVKLNGVPSGIGPLTSAQVVRRPASLKFTRKGRLGPVLKVEAVDDRGRPTALHAVTTYLSTEDDVLARREVRWEFLYDDQNQVTAEVAYDRDGRRVWAFVYSPARAGERVRLGHFLGPDGYPRQTKNYGGGFVQIEYGDNGHERLITYRNSMGNPRPGPDAAFGRRLAHDESTGLLTEMLSIGPDGQPMIDSVGNCGVKLTYDQWGNQVEQIAVDTAGRVTTIKDGWAKERSRYDANGNQVETAYFDEQDRPTLHKDGYHRGTLVRDPRGNPVEYSYWNIDGTPTLAGGCHSFRLEYDDDGNVIQNTCLGLDGQTAPGPRGISIWRTKYDNRNNMLEQTYFDAAGKPVFGDDGYSRVEFKYDERGNQIEAAYLGANGQPVVTQDGFSRTVREYADGRDNETARTYFGVNGQPVLIANTDTNTANESVRTLSYARVQRRFDENGRMVHEAYFDVREQPMPGPDGYAAWRSVYDSAGNRIEVEYLGRRGERVLSPDNGYAGWRSSYDAYGREKRGEYFGLKGEPIESGQGVAIWTSEYDSQGNQIERRLFDADGHPTLNTSGYAGWQTRYDSRGEAIEYLYLGVDGKPAAVPFDVQQPASGGFARRTFRYDARNRLVEHAYFGVDGAPVAGPARWARVVNHYDLRGTEPIRQDFFNADQTSALLDNSYHSIQQRLDSYGRVVEITYHAPNGTRVKTGAGYSQIKRQRDRHGRIVEESYFAEDNSPARLPSGTHTLTLTYDERGRLMEERSFGTRKEPIRMWRAYQHMTRYSYDERGNKVEIAHFDAASKPVIGFGPDRQECSRWLATYKDDGALASSRCEIETGQRRRP